MAQWTPSKTTSTTLGQAAEDVRTLEHIPHDHTWSAADPLRPPSSTDPSPETQETPGTCVIPGTCIMDRETLGICRETDEISICETLTALETHATQGTGMITVVGSTGVTTVVGRAGVGEEGQGSRRGCSWHSSTTTRPL